MSPKRADPSSIDIDHLKNEFDKFRAELGETAGTISDNANAALERIAEYLNSGNLSSRVASLEEELEILGARLKDTGKDAMAKIEAEVGARPITALAVAFGVGMLAASLLRRS
ncbi:hypothetical protein [Acidocella sp.]|uniref:hypothetical protein n=1 Tax=Acidocella sp. TaxID=50710 RepID=UPI0026058602|nr:hypothetical protein [Acidocella sp.]